MSRDVFVWNSNDYSCGDKLEMGHFGWRITNGGTFDIVGKDDSVYNLTPAQVKAMWFFKPGFFKDESGIAIEVARDLRDAAEEAFGTWLPTVCNYESWKKLRSNELIAINILANILGENGVSIEGDYQAFHKRVKKA